MRDNFKVIHFSTSHTGGAGIAARRLNHELNAIGINSIFLSLDKEDYFPESSEEQIKRGLLRRSLSFISRQIGIFTLNVTFFSVFSSSGISTKKVLKFAQNGPVVFHIHNWFNLFSFSQLRKIILSGLPVVITMHDQRLMTGGCHVTLDCEAFTTGCNSCPKIEFILKRKIRRNAKKAESFFKANHNNLRVLAPSRYMVGESQRSKILKTQQVLFVSNPISPNYYSDVKFPKEIRKNIFTVGVASANRNDPLKGGELVSGLASIIDAQKLELELIYLSDFDKDSYSVFWNQIACLLVPSKGENSPNVIHEAKKFGVPIIASRVGGITELLFEGFDIGIDVSELSLENLVQSIFKLKENYPQGELISQMKISHEAYMADPVKKIVEVYKNLLFR